MDEFPCTMCYYVAENHENLVNHLVRKHKHDSNFSMQCSIGGCMYTSKSWNAFKIHVSRKHNCALETSPNPEAMEIDTNVSYDCEENGAILTTIHDTEQQKEMLAAIYLLNMEAQCNLTQRGLDILVSSTQDFMAQFLSSHVESLRYEFSKRDYDQQILQNICTSDVFKNFASCYLRKKFYVEKCGYLQPKDVLLGQTMARKNGRHQPINHYGHIIPFKENLELLLNLPEVWNCVQNPHSNHDGLMRDICDGSYVKNHPLFQKSDTLQITI
ncbi:Uncharacterised protein r2_g3484 [Pycnogonum litorale]